MIPRSIHILYEDSDIIVCAKPHGLATQSKSFASPDLEKLLLNHIARQSGISGKPYLAVIHRLDQPVAGVLVFAKTPFAAKELNRQLQQSGFGKHYLALVASAPPKTSGTLEDYLVKDGRANRSRVCGKTTPGAKLARLHYQVLDPSDNPIFPKDTALSEAFTSTMSASPSSPAALLEVTLDTGRHHQIRVQLAHMGCPIIGDTKYSATSISDPLTGTVPAKAPDAAFISTKKHTPLCLCAYKLSFTHPRTREALCFTYPEKDIFLI